MRCGRWPMRSGGAPADRSRTHPAARSRASTRPTGRCSRSWRLAAGVPVITQGLGGRSKVDAPSKAWEQSRTFLDGSAERGAPVFSLLMTRAFNGTFTLARRLVALRRRAALARADVAGLGRAPQAHRRPGCSPAAARGDRPPEHRSGEGFDASAADLGRPRDRGDSLAGRTRRTSAARLARSRANVAPIRPTSCSIWPSPTPTRSSTGPTRRPAWRELLREVQRHPQMIVGVSDGGAHLDFDDGAEWSTHFLATWWRAERVWRLEEAIRRITAIPAAVLGLTDRGLLKPGGAGRHLHLRSGAPRARPAAQGRRPLHRDPALSQQCGRRARHDRQRRDRRRRRRSNGCHTRPGGQSHMTLDATPQTTGRPA